MEPRSPALQADSLPVEPQESPRITGVGSLSFFQWIFLTQELNQGLLHCRWILYQLSYQGSPYNNRNFPVIENDWLLPFYNMQQFRVCYSMNYIALWASVIAQLVKNPPAMQETLVQFLGQEDLLEKG